MNKYLKKILFPISRLLPDKVYLSLAYKHFFGKKINWDNPETFNEKIQWLKIHDHNPLYNRLVDKYEAKSVLESLIGREYIIPVYGVWNKYEDIPFEKLPQKFVLKCTHDSGSVFIINNKNDINHKELKKKITRSLKRNFFWFGREWPYKNVTPRIIAEQLLEDEKGILDYKVFSFNGKARALFVASDRNNKSSETKFDFYNTKFEPMDLTNGHPKSGKAIGKPKNFDKMIEISETITNGIPQARIDFYEIDSRLYVGEVTFYHWSGFKKFEPDYWDKIFGDWIDLSCLQ